MTQLPVGSVARAMAWPLPRVGEKESGGMMRHGIFLLISSTAAAQSSTAARATGGQQPGQAGFPAIPAWIAGSS